MNFFGLDLTSLANATIVLLTALVTYAAVQIGRRTSKPEPLQAAGIAVEGAAIISSKAILDLNIELAALRTALAGHSAAHAAEGEKTRKVGYRLAEVSDRLVDELGEARRDVTALTMEIARSK